jgi:putative transposase
MLNLTYKIDGVAERYAAIDEAIRTTQFIRNKCLRKWMDADKAHPVTANDLQTYCADLAAEFPFAAALGSQARQVAADRTWDAISRFYTNCKQHVPGKKGYPQFQHDCRSGEYKTQGWRLSNDGRHITFTDGKDIGRLRLIGKKAKEITSFACAPTWEDGKLVPDDDENINSQWRMIKRVRIVRRADGYYCQFVVDTSWEVSHTQTGKHLGIDVGINAYYTDSEGNKVENPRFLKQTEERLTHWHREVSHKSVRHKQNKKPKLSRKRNKYPKGQPVIKAERTPQKQWHTHATSKQTLRRNERKQKQQPSPSPLPVNRNLPPEQGKQSHNYQKARKHLAKTYLHLQRQREDYARKTACALARSSDLIACENLQIHNLAKNHKLAKAISDVAWGRFLHWMKYYASQHGILCIAVPPQFTSQDCSGILPNGTRCPERVYKSLSVRTHICPRCGLIIDRDHNSGKLVLERALELMAEAVSVPSGRRKQAHPA